MAEESVQSVDFDGEAPFAPALVRVSHSDLHIFPQDTQIAHQPILGETVQASVHDHGGGLAGPGVRLQQGVTLFLNRPGLFAGPAAFALDPELPEARLALATYYYRGFYDYERALEQLEIARRQLPSDADVLYFMGLTLRRLGRWDESVAAFHEATLLDPANVTTAGELINTALDAGDLEAGWEASGRLLARFPDNAVLAAHTALLYLHGEGDIEGARRALDAVEPIDEWAYAYAAMETAFFERDFETALAVISEYGNNFDVVAPGFSTMLSGEVLLVAGDAAGAERRLERARAVLEEEVGKPYAATYVWPHIPLAMTYAYLGETELALESCRRAQTILPESKDKVHGVNASYYCAFTRALVGETEVALPEIERLLHTPAGVTRHQLALDPRWDFLRDDPRFQALVASD